MFINTLVLLTLLQADKIQTLEQQPAFETHNETAPQCYNNLQPHQTCFYVNEEEWIKNFESTGIPFWYYTVLCYHCNLQTIPLQNLHIERKKYLQSITIIGNLEDHIIQLDQEILKNCINLKRLVVSSIRIHDIQTNYFENLQNLEKILIRNVTLEQSSSQIPKNIFEHFKNLKYLSITETNLSRISHDYFKYLINLQELYLNHNQIVTIDANTFSANLNLEQLDLSYNLIGEIPTGLTSNLVNLKSIDLSNNPIHSVDFNDLMSSRNLKYLFCYNWPCDIWAPYMNSVVKQFQCKSYDQNGVCIEVYLSSEMTDNHIQIYGKNLTVNHSIINHLPCVRSKLL